MMGDEISTAYIGTINFEVYNTIISAIDRARREVAATGLGYEHPIEAGFLYNVNTVLLSFQCEDSFMLDRTISLVVDAIQKSNMKAIVLYRNGIINKTGGYCYLIPAHEFARLPTKHTIGFWNIFGKTYYICTYDDIVETDGDTEYLDVLKKNGFNPILNGPEGVINFIDAFKKTYSMTPNESWHKLHDENYVSYHNKIVCNENDKVKEKSNSTECAGDKIRKMMDEFFAPFLTMHWNINDAEDGFADFIRSYMAMYQKTYGADYAIKDLLIADPNKNPTNIQEIAEFNYIQKYWGYPYRAIIEKVEGVDCTIITIQKIF